MNYTNLIEEIVGKKLAEDFLQAFPFCTDILNASAKDIAKIPGIGIKKAETIKKCMALGIMTIETKRSVGQRLVSPSHVYNMMEPLLRHAVQEEFWVLFVNTKAEVIRKFLAGKGTANACIVSARDIAREGIMCGAVSCIVVHNHPSGNPDPSVQDIDVTDRLKKCLEVMDITLLDHVIIGDGRFISLQERGVIR